MTVEDLLTNNEYTFELQEELIRNSECDSWKEIPVKVDALTKTAGSDQQMTDDHKQNNAVSDADNKDAPLVEAAVADPTRLSESQLSGIILLSTWFKVLYLNI